MLTLQSIAGMITTIGILTRSGMEHFYRIFKDYENMNVDSYTRSDVNDPAVRGLDAFLPIAGSDGSRYATNQPGYINFLLNFRVSPFPLGSSTPCCYGSG
jgi:hypothetical protein